MGPFRKYAVLTLALWSGVPTPSLAQLKLPTSSPPVGGAIDHPNYALSKCGTSANVAVFWILLPGTMYDSNPGRQVWHRPSPFNAIAESGRPTRAYQNRPDEKEPYDLFYEGTSIASQGLVVVRVLAPARKDYRFYYDKDAGVYGVGKTRPSDANDPSTDSICQSPDNFPAKPGLDLNVTSFMIDRTKIPSGSCVEFNIVVEKPTGTHEGVRYLDPKIHNDGNPAVPC